MNEEEFLKESELRDCDVSGAGGLKALDTADPDPDVGGLDHTNIVCAVTDR
ncbi:hypothetical protein PGTUg99_025535 [Puccinia graminis f. sp. tritici]|uniref:Uncharacterized protein n=1 Tax=Puccinia graminis f. sp. tritici TaxID=56615 RepID=A0A5B0LT13_PUCGR|nr:hypothetical protein PGTUg99_025535 [Puccinia graminis f. sp. tritici]